MLSGLRSFSRRGRRSYKGKCQPTRVGHVFCRSPAPGAMLSGLRGFSRRGRRSYRGNVRPQGLAMLLVGAPPPGRCWVVCEAFRDEGVAPTRGNVRPPRLAMLFVGAPPSGRCWVVCEAFRDEGVAPTGVRSDHRGHSGFCVPAPPAHWPVNCGARFSMKCATPSRKSSLSKLRAISALAWRVFSASV